jgi:hypothetical protein
LNRIKAIVVLVLLGLGLIVATAPGASAATYCGTYTKTWYLSDGSVITIRIMTIKTHLEVCTDGRSVTAAYESVESSFTGPGVTAGWHGGYGPTYRTSFDSNRGAWFSSNGYLRDCESHYTALLCSRSEGYLVNSSVVIQPIVVVKPAAGQLKIGGRVFTFSFSPHDSGGSQVHFNNTI